MINGKIQTTERQSIKGRLMMEPTYDWVENIVSKGAMFSRGFSLWFVTSWDCTTQL